MTPHGTANIFDKAAKLLAQSDEDFIFIFHRFCEASRLGKCAAMGGRRSGIGAGEFD